MMVTLSRIVQQGLLGARNIIQEHLEGPAREIYKELFYQHESVNALSAQAEASRASLQRMIGTFLQKVPASKVLNDGVSRSDIDIVVGVIEESMPRALNSLLFGDMLQALLIQVQALKASMEEEAAAMSALMKANQMSMQMMAAVPAIFFVGGVVYTLRRAILWVLQEPAFPRRNFNQLLRGTERLLIAGSQQNEGGLATGASDEEASNKELAADLQWGNLCLLVHKMQTLLRTINISNESKIDLRADLDLLVSVKPSVESKRFLLDSLITQLPHIS